MTGDGRYVVISGRWRATDPDIPEDGAATHVSRPPHAVINWERVS
ncbi:hypothetical protein [Paractinoplanes brasiliensis]|nr:hypothetical protein [Actinoplanes brasiliensis]GID31680.1 hypothetical protein Abr02nite_66630 [Actinoplanes brasiliensis]